LIDKTYISAIVLLCVALLGIACFETKKVTNITDIPQPVWSDEFDYTGLPDSMRWSYDVGDGCPNICGWGNNELQYYTAFNSKNARVENGKLIIEAHKIKTGERAYSSARLVSKKKGDWT